jgi:hypothetical protein
VQLLLLGLSVKMCFPELRKWENGEDWYGNIPAPFTTLYIEDKQVAIYEAIKRTRFEEFLFCFERLITLPP